MTGAKHKQMKILIYHKTTDSDLKKGLQVCYQDQNGAFTKLGVITDTIIQDGITLYLINTAMGAYAASELKLIASQLNSVKVLFEDSRYNYETSVSANTTKESAGKYFIGQDFDLGIYPAENMQTCTGIEFTDNNLPAFKISFIGRLVGAIGKRYKITETVKAIDQEAAELKLYDKYEHIAVLGCIVSK